MKIAAGKDRIQLSKEHRAYKWLPFSETGLDELELPTANGESLGFQFIIEFMNN